MADKAVSLIPGSTAALRRAVAGPAAANGAPNTPDDVQAALGMFSEISVIAKTTVGGASFDFCVWWWHDATETWVMDTTIGTAGVVAVTAAGGPVKVGFTFLCANAMYVEVRNFVGAPLPSVWIVGRGTRR